MHDHVVLVDLEFNDAVIPWFEEEAPGVGFVPWPAEGPPPTADALVTLRTTADRIRASAGAGVRWIHSLGTGVDGIPLAAVDGDSQTVTCSRGASAVPIAEYVLAAMLAFEKQIPDVYIDAYVDDWNFGANLGTLAGKTLGLVGFGAIGSEVARRATAFDMDVIVFRRSNRAPRMDGVRLAGSLHEMLGLADHVVVAAPATPETRHMIDAKALSAMKPGAHLVNIARGSLVDQDALRSALDGEHLARASLDVADPEPLPEGHWLFTHPRVRLTPHVSWSAPQSAQRTIELFLENLHRFIEDEPLEGIVDLEAGY